MKIKKMLVIALILLIIAVVSYLVSGLYIFDDDKEYALTTEMTLEYLNSKYEEEMILTEWVGEDKDGWIYYAEAYPKSEPELTFMIIYNSITKEFEDEYIIEYIDFEIKSVLKKEIHYTLDVDYNVSIMMDKGKDNKRRLEEYYASDRGLRGFDSGEIISDVSIYIYTNKWIDSKNADITPFIKVFNELDYKAEYIKFYISRKRKSNSPKKVTYYYIDGAYVLK